ncbi:MAG: TolC family protein [Thermodesulfobacteriota bacterium]|nr:TolC family protein [Thermodesulfobacteriota bacterium]
MAVILLSVHMCCISSCGWRPVKMFGEDHTAFSHNLARQSFQGGKQELGESVPGPGNAATLTLENCRHIALTNNLAIQSAALEGMTRQNLASAEWAKMLPHTILSAKFDQGDNIIYSDIPGDSYWAGFYERSSWHLFLEARWSPTDVALAYYSARNSDNRVLQSFYEKARTSQKIVESVETAFFKLLGYQECLPLAQDLVGLRKDIASRMGRLQKDRLASIEDYQKALNEEIRAQNMLAELSSESQNQARILLMYLGRPVSSIPSTRAVAVSGDLTCPSLSEIPPDPELVALKNRPEIYTLGLKHLASIHDLRRSMVKNFPRVTMFWRYLNNPYHHRFAKDGYQAGLLLYLDLVDSLASFQETKAASNSKQKTEKELSAAALAIASQAAVAATKCRLSVEKAQIRARAVAGAEKVVQAAEERVRSRDLSDISERRAKAELALEKIEWLKAVGDALVNLAELKSATGMNHSLSL